MGSALLDADWGAALSMLPSSEEAEGLADFFCDTPAQAERGPKWFSARRGIAAVSWLLANGNGKKTRRLLTEAVCTELEHVLRILDGARRPGYRFHFVEAESGEDLSFAGPALSDEPENNQMQERTAPGQSARRR